jgi:succinyl-diaminopimelate desuccinylase
MARQPAAELTADDALSLDVLTRVLQELVRTESVNPGTPESGMADTVERWLEGLPVEVSRVEFAPSRTSVGVRLAGAADGPALVLNGHMDTVPVDDRSRWTHDPFGGTVENGFLYGRGACDMKAGLAVQIGVVRALARHRDSLHGSLVLHFAAGEERGEPGTLSLLEAGFRGDYGIVTEPTELNISVATRGAAFIRIVIKGRSIHASRAQDGINPIYKLSPVLAAIERYDQELSAKPHPLLPGGSITPTVVNGGVKENAVADFCELLLDRRLLPSEEAERELDELRRRLDPIRQQDPEFEYELSHFVPPLDGAEIEADSELVTLVTRAAEQTLGSTPAVYGSPYGSDVRNLVRDAGIEALTFGPGSILDTHCLDERVELRQVRDAALVIATAAERLLLARTGVGS